MLQNQVGRELKNLVSEFYFFRNKYLKVIFIQRYLYDTNILLLAKLVIKNRDKVNIKRLLKKSFFIANPNLGGV